jgi:hypothetical protein
VTVWPGGSFRDWWAGFTASLPTFSRVVCWSRDDWTVGRGTFDALGLCLESCVAVSVLALDFGERAYTWLDRFELVALDGASYRRWGEIRPALDDLLTASYS